MIVLVSLLLQPGSSVLGIVSGPLGTGPDLLHGLEDLLVNGGNVFLGELGKVGLDFLGHCLGGVAAAGGGDNAAEEEASPIEFIIDDLPLLLQIAPNDLPGLGVVGEVGEDKGNVLRADFLGEGKLQDCQKKGERVFRKK